MGDEIPGFLCRNQSSEATCSANEMCQWGELRRLEERQLAPWWHPSSWAPSWSGLPKVIQPSRTCTARHRNDCCAKKAWVEDLMNEKDRMQLNPGHLPLTEIASVLQALENRVMDAWRDFFATCDALDWE